MDMDTNPNDVSSRRRYIIACDGTGQRGTAEAKTNSNPYTLLQLVSPHIDGIEQVIAYQQGIGTLKDDHEGLSTFLTDTWDMALGDGKQQHL